MEHGSPLISPGRLRQRLPEVTVLDVRWQLGGPPGHADYLRGHVPGAVYVDLESDLADPPGDRGRHPLPDPGRFARAMRRCGVRGDRTVVVYDAVQGTSAARCWWLLRYHGHRDVLVLDGGYDWWVREGGPVEQGDVAAPAGDFRASPGQLPVLDAAGAARVAREGVLVDARAGERFRGEVEPVDPVAGHIPGAVSVPAARNLVGPGAREGTVRQREELAGEYQAAGVRPGTEVGVYCGSGVTAAHDVLALHLLGTEAALYPGSWSEWVTDPGRPVATGE
jgi:thiosulfate/3-mercaptopyruvate sulfurtransferase